MLNRKRMARHRGVREGGGAVLSLSKGAGNWGSPLEHIPGGRAEALATADYGTGRDSGHERPIGTGALRGSVCVSLLAHNLTVVHVHDTIGLSCDVLGVGYEDERLTVVAVQLAQQPHHFR